MSLVCGHICGHRWAVPSFNNCIACFDDNIISHAIHSIKIQFNIVLYTCAVLLMFKCVNPLFC